MSAKRVIERLVRLDIPGDYSGIVRFEEQPDGSWEYRLVIMLTGVPLGAHSLYFSHN